MALDKQVLEGLIISKLQGSGFKTSGDHAFVQVIANAVAESVVEHIQAAAVVPVNGGSSAGNYKVT